MTTEHPMWEQLVEALDTVLISRNPTYLITQKSGESGQTGDARGITSADVLHTFPGSRVLSEEEAKALKIKRNCG